MEPETTQSLFAIHVGVVRGVITALTMAVFLGISWWAYHSGNRERFERDAMMVFDDETSAPDADPESAGEQEEDEQ